MNEAPDLSKIVNMIMSNPELIEQIKGMANSTGSESAPSEGADTVKELEKRPEPLSKNEKRNMLLSGLKPYLREDRQKTLDTMLTFANMLEAVRGK